MNGYPYARLNTFHGPKRQLLGNKAGHAAPAWRTNVMPLPGQGIAGNSRDVEQGSKIFLSRLPVDVGEKEVEVRDYVGYLPNSCSPIFMLGAVQEDGRAVKGVISRIQFTR